MKYFAMLLLLCALLGSVLAILKNSVCGETSRMVGPCRAKTRSWTYDEETSECVVFNYGGCQGNNNRFNSQSECEETCKF